MNAPPLIPLDVVKHVLFPFVIELGGLRCVVPLLLVCKSVRDFAYTNIAFWMRFLEANRLRFLSERLVRFVPPR
jgi:hypothetical protein